MHDFKFAWRTLRSAPLASLTIVSTIALGLGVVAVAFTFFNAFFFRVDAVRNPDELFAVSRPERPGSSSEIPFTRAEYEAIQRETTVFTDVAAMRPAVATRMDGRGTRGTFVSGNFFQMLGVSAARGRTLTPADNDGGGRAVVVLSHGGWQKLLTAAPDVVGRSLRLNGRPFDVVGVMPEDFRGLRQEPQDYWAPLALVNQFRIDERPEQRWVDVIGRLKPGTSPDSAASALTAWASTRPDIRTPDNGIVQVVLRENRGVLSKNRGEAMVAFMPIFFAFGLILMIGCANVANLLLARGLSRGREIGVRLSLGATRGRIVRQLLTENVLLALVAAAVGFLVSRALLAGSLYLVTTILPPEFAESIDVLIPPADWRVWAFLLGGAFAATLMFGLVPALHSTRVELVRSMRGEVTKGARPSRIRQMLIASQVTASALLLVCAGVFLRSTYAAAGADAGVRTDDTAVIRGISESVRPAMIHAIAAHPAVASVAASWPEPMGSGAIAEGRVGDTTLELGCRFVSSAYFDVLGITLIKGRVFTPAERDSAAGVAVISESVATRFWPNGDALGHQVRLTGAPTEAAPEPGAPRVPAQLVTVIGVVRDVRSALTMFDFSYSGIYLPTTAEQTQTSFVVRVHGDPDTARRALLDSLTIVDPALGEITTMRMLARMETAVLEVVFWMAVILGGFALLLTVSGLFSVLSYLVERRRKEIGVRMALGARPRDVVALVVSQSMRPIAIGVIAGGGLAAVTAVVLLAMPIAERLGTVIHAFDPVAYGAGLGVIVATCLAAAFIPARRAARINPIATLRAD